MARTSGAADLIEFIAKAIVTDPSAIRVREQGSVVELETAPGDRGRVIGRQGRIAKAMRVVLASSRVGTNHRLEILD